MEAPQPTDEALLAESSREGSDGLAFAELVERHRQRVWQICYRLMGDEHDAQDAAQEVFVRLFLARNTFAQRSKFTTWLHGIAVRTCLTLRRGRGRRRRRETTAVEPTLPEPTAAAGNEPGTALDLTTMLDSLSEDDRALLIMKYAEGYTFEELAEIFEITPSAAKMRVSRCREKLQERFPQAGLAP